MQQQTVTLIGHLTAEPFYREFDTGRKFAQVSAGHLPAGTPIRRQQRALRGTRPTLY